MTDTARPTVCVLGGTGSFGGAVADALIEAGYPVRILARTPGRAERRFGSGVTVIAGDVQDKNDLLEASAECRIIVHGVNYPYDRWVPFMHTATLNVIAAARQSGATVLFPGNVYGLGNQTDGPLAETAENRATTKKGKIRIRMEAVLEEATRPPEGDDAQPEAIRVIILRANDYFGPTGRNGMVDRIFGMAARGRPMQVFGRLDIGHEWVFLPDLARAAVALIERAGDLAPFEVVNFRGHVPKTQGDFLRQVATRAGEPDLAIRVLPWWLLRLYGLFDGPVRELIELRYLFENSLTLDDGKLRGLLPDFALTPLDEAIDQTLESYRP